MSALALSQDAAPRARRARWLAGLAVGFGLFFYILGAALKPGYSSAASYISELNATGTAWATQLSYFGFLPLGLILAAFLVVARPIARVGGASALGWWLLWSQPVAFIGTALAPCDIGCPIGGSPTQNLHDLLAMTTYFAGALSLALLAFAPAHSRFRAGSRAFLLFSGIAFLVIFVAMLDPALAPVRGLLQRGADALFALALLLIAWRLLEDGHSAVAVVGTSQR